MKVEKNVYEAPQLEVVEITVEQPILQASGGDYPGPLDEFPL